MGHSLGYERRQSDGVILLLRKHAHVHEQLRAASDRRAKSRTEAIKVKALSPYSHGVAYSYLEQVQQSL